MAASEMARRKMNRYLRFNVYRADGYIDRLDTSIFTEIIAAQIDEGIRGSLVEIGVHYGRSFFLLASGRFGSEKSLGIDLFEDDALHSNREGIGRFGGFNANCRKFEFAFSDDEILKGSSLELTPDRIVKRVGSVRFFSVDGGHMYEHVANDLALAEGVLAPGGVICADDILNPLWPEVAMATFDWLRTTKSGLVPFLQTKDKLYICHRDYVDFYFKTIRDTEELRSRIFRAISVLSHEVLVLFPSPTMRVTERLMQMLVSLGRQANLIRRLRNSAAKHARGLSRNVPQPGSISENADRPGV